MCKRCDSVTVTTRMYKEWDIPRMLYYSYYEENDEKIPSYFLGTGEPECDQIIMYCGRKLGENI